MTTAASSPTRTGAGGTADVCRLTVNAPSGRTDLAVPASMAVADLLPVLLTHAVEEEDLGSRWALQRLGEAPLDLDGTPETLGLHDGDILHLRPKDDLLSELCFDDIADGVATAVGAQPHRWQPRLTRGLCLGLACLALAALAALVVGSRPDPLVPYTCGVLALGLIVGCGVATRVYGDRTAATITGLGACMFAGLAGAPGPGLLDSRLDGLLTAAFAAVAAAAVLAFAQVPIVVFGTVLTLAGTAELGCWLSLGLGWDAPRVAAVLAAAMFALTPLAPRLALFAAKLRVVELPHNAEELQQGIDPLPESLVTRRAAAADGYLSVFFLSFAAVSTVAFALLVRVPGWSSWVFTLVFSATVLLRARDVGNARQRIALVTAGALGVILLLLAFQAHASAVARAGSMLVLFAVVPLLLMGARKLPGARLRPIWGRLGEIMEGLLALALLPLLLQVLHAYAYFRALAG
ncbi:type VII secretion integral membrane protein EccD [Streptomyces sp. TRM68367]|uniref:type VII secretion integral membrane protein EccD n=1 Tax=Streptomyces sp. TRM68367 TaxID=2758415 RepID=UPI00165B2669|nr:type VII secretion integral membrane protein EccD [Streptomyces sp. TRM68367]MBC9730532.1 type VII secretion integral membrane protein EccD [Streptomyces sp. TRM68367]